jgi:hypothetical protein
VLSFRRRFQVQVQLRDILALVVGYALAAVLFRAFWPATLPAVLLTLPILALYVWLGLAMSGPMLLLRDGPKVDLSVHSANQRGTAATRTWAELAWILIGTYWIVLGLLVIPARLHHFEPMDAVLYGVVPILAALGFRFLGPSSSLTAPGVRPWTHFVAVGLLATWPIAWVCLIVLGQSLR